MSSQEDEKEKEIVDVKQNPHKKDYLSSIDFNMGHYMNNSSSTSSLPQEKRRAPPRNFDDLVNYLQTVKTIKKIKSNFLEEHRYIINMYYSIYSNRLKEILDCNLNNLISEKYSKAYRKVNRNLLDNQLDTTKIIDDIVVKNMDTFIKSIELVHKFYFDVLQSCYNYITMFKNESYK